MPSAAYPARLRRLVDTRGAARPGPAPPAVGVQDPGVGCPYSIGAKGADRIASGGSSTEATHAAVRPVRPRLPALRLGPAPLPRQCGAGRRAARPAPRLPAPRAASPGRARGPHPRQTDTGCGEANPAELRRRQRIALVGCACEVRDSRRRPSGTPPAGSRPSAGSAACARCLPFHRAALGHDLHDRLEPRVRVA